MYIPDLRKSAIRDYELFLHLAVVQGRQFLPVTSVEGAYWCHVGWLGDSVPTTGPLFWPCIDRLVQAYLAKSFFKDPYDGWHDCEICTTEDERAPGGVSGPMIKWCGRHIRVYGYGRYMIKHDRVIYMCPVLVLHYMLDHSYSPPREFIDAVEHGDFLVQRSSYLTYLVSRHRAIDDARQRMHNEGRAS